MSDMSRLDFFSLEVVVSNWAAMLASVSVLVTCQRHLATVNPFYDSAIILSDFKEVNNVTALE